MSGLAVSNLHDTLKKHLPPAAFKEVSTVLNGAETPEVSCPRSCRTGCRRRRLRGALLQDQLPRRSSCATARIVKVAAVQNAILLPTDAPIKDQYQALCDRIERLVNAAAGCGANIVCLQEAWTGPFFFCTREKMPWCELAECPETGPSFDLISRLAKQQQHGDRVPYSGARPAALRGDLEHRGCGGEQRQLHREAPEEPHPACPATSTRRRTTRRATRGTPSSRLPSEDRNQHLLRAAPPLSTGTSSG